jgi:hypothetical protein
LFSSNFGIEVQHVDLQTGFGNWHALPLLSLLVPWDSISLFAKLRATLQAVTGESAFGPQFTMAFLFHKFQEVSLSLSLEQAFFFHWNDYFLFFKGFPIKITIFGGCLFAQKIQGSEEENILKHFNSGFSISWDLTEPRSSTQLSLIFDFY